MYLTKEDWLVFFVLGFSVGDVMVQGLVLCGIGQPALSVLPRVICASQSV